MKNILLALSFLSICTATQGQKMVLFEKFTNAFCGVCPDATLDLMDIVEEHPNAIWISHHKPVTWTDNPLTNDKSTAIWNDLGISGVPQGMVDRTIYGNSITLTQSQWRPRIIKQLQLSSTFVMNIDQIEYDAIDRTLSFDVNTQAINPLQGPHRISAYIVEDSVTSIHQNSYWNDVPGHPLEGRGDIIWDYYHRNVVRTVLDDHWGIANVIPNQPIIGEEYSHTFTYTIPEEYKPERMKLVVMVALFDEVNNYPGEVQNATQLNLRDAGLILSDTKEIPSNLIAIYPNPTSDFLNLNFKVLPENIKILDASGNMKMEYTPSQLNTVLDIQSLNTGNYYLVVDLEGQLSGHVFSKVE